MTTTRAARSLCGPVAEAVAAEAGEPHQVDILGVRPVAQMFDQPAIDRGRDTIVDVFELHDLVSPG